MREIITATPLTWSRVFPAVPAQAREARRSLARILDGHPAADDAALCLSELAANACLHSRSREPGGHFTVRAALWAGRLRVEVHDQGGPWTQPRPGSEQPHAHRLAPAQRARWPQLHPDGGQHGHGLLIVSRLARDWGVTGDCDTGWAVWFVMDGLLDGPLTGPRPGACRRLQDQDHVSGPRPGACRRPQDQDHV